MGKGKDNEEFNNKEQRRGKMTNDELMVLRICGWLDSWIGVMWGNIQHSTSNIEHPWEGKRQ